PAPAAFLMARSTASRVMFAFNAAAIAARSRGLDAGSGNPARAETVISRINFAKARARLASCAPLRCMMFLNCECPAMAAPRCDYCGRKARPGLCPWTPLRAEPLEPATLRGFEE